VGTRTAALNVAQSGTAQPLTTALTGIGLVAPSAVIQFYPAQLNYVAGNGGHPPQCNDTGDNGPATSAELCQPYAAAMDAAGNTYMVDYGDNVVKKIDTSGTITTFAGVEGLAGGYGGDGGPATSATFSGPVGIAFDASGNAYISDSGNGRIREVNASTGIITTFVGGGPGVYFNPGTSGTNVALLQPGGITFDPSGNLYIAVDGQQIVAKVTPAGVATLFAGVLTQSGPGAAGYNGDNIPANTGKLNGPQQVASDTRGDIFIADTGNFRIREVDATTGIITTVAGNGTQGDTGDGGLATSAEIGAEGVAVDLAGDVYESDNVLGGIRKVNVDTGDILTVAGGGTGPVGGAANLAGISVGLPAVDNFGNVLIPDGETGQAALLSEGSTGFLQFGSEPVGSTTAPLTITIFNVGDAELDFTSSTFTASGDFAVTGGTCINDEGPGAEGCTLTVTFTPTATGTRTGSIVVASNSVGGGSNTILLNGTGTANSTPVATLTPSTIAFGSQTITTTSAAQTLTLSNTGNASLTGIAVFLTGANPGDFADTSACGTTLAAGASCNISVTFTPASATSFTATLSVADNATGSPQTASLTGTGTAAAAPVATLTPTTVAFGNQAVSTTSSAQTVVLSNTGNASLTGIAVSLTGANPGDFADTSACGTTLAAGASCNISVTFTPASAANFTATLSVADNAAGSPQTASLTGTGTTTPVPVATLTPSTVAFGNQTVGTTSAAQTLTLSNTGNAVLNITSITPAGAPFTQVSSTCGATLAASASCTLSYAFSPTATGNFTGSVTVVDNAAGSPQTASLTGTGTAVPAPIATLSPTTVTFPVTTVGTTSSAQTLTLSNTGNATLTISNVSLGGTNPSEFADTSACGSTLAAGASCTITVTFTPDAASSFTATLSVTDNAASSPQTATLNGTGQTVAADFGITATPARLSVPSGVVAQFTLSLTGINGDYDLPVTLSVTGLPANATASFTPASVVPGSSATSVLSVATPSLTGAMMLTPPPGHTSNRLPLLALLLIPLLGLRKARKRMSSRAARLLTFAAITFAALLPLSGCGGGYFGPAPHTYTLTVTGTSGNLQHSTTVTLTVQ
jgi:hypothetical protein